MTNVIATGSRTSYSCIKKTHEREVNVMARKYIDCRDYPGDTKCTLAISADSEDELLEAAVQHATKVHGYKDTPDFRKEIRKEFKEGAPPA